MLQFLGGVVVSGSVCSEKRMEGGGGLVTVDEGLEVRHGGV